MKLFIGSKCLHDWSLGDVRIYIENRRKKIYLKDNSPSDLVSNLLLDDEDSIVEVYYMVAEKFYHCVSYRIDSDELIVRPESGTISSYETEVQKKIQKVKNLMVETIVTLFAALNKCKRVVMSDVSPINLSEYPSIKCKYVDFYNIDIDTLYDEDDEYEDGDWD